MELALIKNKIPPLTNLIICEPKHKEYFDYIYIELQNFVYQFDIFNFDKKLEIISNAFCDKNKAYYFNSYGRMMVFKIGEDVK